MEDDDFTKDLVDVQAATESETTQTAPVEEKPAPERLPTPRCGFCQSFLFVEGKSGVNTFNIQMGEERVRIFTCAVCESVLPIQVMMIATPMIAAPGAQGGRLVRH